MLSRTKFLLILQLTEKTSNSFSFMAMAWAKYICIAIFVVGPSPHVSITLRVTLFLGTLSHQYVPLPLPVFCSCFSLFCILLFRPCSFACFLSAFNAFVCGVKSCFSQKKKKKKQFFPHIEEKIYADAVPITKCSLLIN